MAALAVAAAAAGEMIVVKTAAAAAPVAQELVAAKTAVVAGTGVAAVLRWQQRACRWQREAKPKSKRRAMAGKYIAKGEKKNGVSKDDIAL